MADSGKKNAFPRMSIFKLKTRPVSTEGNCVSPSLEEPELCERLKAEDFIVTKVAKCTIPLIPCFKFVIQSSFSFIESVVGLYFLLLQTYRYGFPDRPTCISYDPVQSILAIGTKDGSLKLYP